MNKLLGVRDKLTIPVVAGDPKPFKLSINLMWLRGAIDGAKRSDGGERWYARVSIVDHISPVHISPNVPKSSNSFVLRLCPTKS